MSGPPPIRVAHVTTVHSSADTRIFRKECRSLAAAGYEVHLLATDGRPSVTDGVVIEPFSGPTAGRLARMTVTSARAYRAARRVAARVYHFHDPELLPVALALRRAGVAVVYDVHEDTPAQILSKPWIAPALRSAVARAFDVYERRSARRLSAIVAASETVAQRFEGVAPRTVVVRNFPMLGDFERAGPDSIATADAVCYVGGVTEVRGFRELVTAIGMTDVRLLVVGRFDSPEFRRELEQLPGWRNVVELGQLPHAELGEVFRACFAGVITYLPVPNHLDLRSNKLFEYMAGGLPLVASAFPLWREVVEGNGCGLCVDPADPAAIAKAINRLAADRTEAQRLGANGLRAIEAGFNWESECRTLLELYSSLTGAEASSG